MNRRRDVTTKRIDIPARSLSRLDRELPGFARRGHSAPRSGRDKKDPPLQCTRVALQERTGPRFARELPAVDDHLAARQDGFGDARHLPSFIRVVVHLHVMRLRRQRRLLLRIEDDDVGVGARRDRAFLREHAEDLRGRRRGQLDESIHRDLAGPHAAVVDQAHARLDARRAVRDLREVGLAEMLLFHAERAVIGGDRLEIVARESAPQSILRRLVAQRRAHHVLRSFEARLFVVVVRQEQILRTGFRERRQSAIARFGHHLERFGGGEVDDVDRHVGDLGERDRAMRGFTFRARRPRQRVILRRGLAVLRAPPSPARR